MINCRDMEHKIGMNKVSRFFTVWMIIVLSFGNEAIGFTHSAETNVNTANSSNALPLASRWIQTNWSASNSFFNLCSSKNKVFVRTWDSFNGGCMFLTTGDGKSWTQIGSADNSIDILSIVMLDSRILAGTWNGFIQSTDDGTTWNAFTPTGIPADTAIWSIVMINNTLFAGTTGAIYKSSDKGNTWTEISSGIAVDARITSIAASGENIFAGSAGNGVFKSTNGGTSWTAINSNLTDTHISQLVVLDNKLFAITLTGVFISDNSGTSWGADPSLLKNVNCLVAVNDLLIAGTDDNGAYLSVDKGVTWNSFSSGMPASTRIWSLAVSSASIFAGTSSGIWVTGSPTEVKEERESSVPSTFTLKQNYPNPFNSATTISFEIPRQTFIELSVYDIKGEKIQSIIKGNYGAGNYSINFDASLLSSGVYFYQLKHSQGIITNKMLLIK
jgi:photosystem II stability/assembly factor-like uncharacterized protein